MRGITPFLWFDNQAEEAASLYTSILPNSRILSVSRIGEAGPGPAGSVMIVSFELNGQPYTALNGGPMFQFTEAISFQIACESQEEVDYYWEKLLEGGQESQCGWLKDRFGLSWQVIPTALFELLSSGDAAQTRRVTEAMLKMVKLDIAGLRAAAVG
ncbi:MAG: VOC family protein [Chloroflexi bacterium]|nr:VOC family protein [Chloroflexota bacterium]